MGNLWGNLWGNLSLWYLWNLWEIYRNCMGKSMVFSFWKCHFLTGNSVVNPHDKWIQKWCVSYVISLVYLGRYTWSMAFSPGISTAAPKKKALICLCSTMFDHTESLLRYGLVTSIKHQPLIWLWMCTRGSRMYIIWLYLAKFPCQKDPKRSQRTMLPTENNTYEYMICVKTWYQYPFLDKTSIIV